jgi:transposase-like protein
MNKKLNFTQEQVTKILENIAEEKDGYNKVMQIAMEALMRAEREEFNNENRDVSNGYRPRRFFGKGKELVLSVPRSRHHKFYPILLSVLKEEDREAKELAFYLYGAGLTTGQVGELFDKIYGKHYSTSQISRMFDFAREEVQAWLERPLLSYYPIIYIDAVFISVRRGDSVIKEAFYTILGVRPDRTREVLSVVNKPGESARGWNSVFKKLRERGVQEIGLVISDALNGIEDAVAGVFSCSHQFCTVHLERNVLKEIRKKDKSEISEELQEVFNPNNPSDTVETAWNRWKVFIEKHQNKYPALKKMLTERYRLYFTYFKYDYRIRSMLYTTNWIERLNRDYRRVTRMRGALPNVDAVLLLLGHVAMYKKAYLRKIPKLNYEKSFRWED